MVPRSDWLLYWDSAKPKRAITPSEEKVIRLDFNINNHWKSQSLQRSSRLVIFSRGPPTRSLASSRSQYARPTLTFKMLIRLFVLLAAVAPHAFADVEFTTPSAGATEAGGQVLKVAWKESGTSPPISDLLTYQLFLCAGGNDATSFVRTEPDPIPAIRALCYTSAEAKPFLDPIGPNRCPRTV